MRLGWLGLGAASLLMAVPALSQVSVYGELSAVKLTNMVSTHVFFGPVVGVTAELGGLKRLKFSGDLRGQFYGTGVKYDGIAVGPKVSLLVKGFDPYAEFMVGFARYNDGTNTTGGATTDAQVVVNVGVDRRVAPRVDWRIFEFGYQQYYALGGQFNPKTFATGVVVHLGGK